MRKRYKRDYMILESKDPSFRLKEKISPKAFAKIETKEEKINIMIYVENVKYVKSGYRIILMQDDLTTRDIGRVLVNERGKGEFKINFDEENLEVKSIALTHENDIPLIGFKGKNIENYKELINENVKRTESVVEDLDKEEVIEIDLEPRKENENLKTQAVDLKDKKRKEEDIQLEQDEVERAEKVEEVEETEEIEEEVENDKKKNEEKILSSQKEKTEEKIDDNQEQDEYRKQDEKVYLIPRKLKKLLKKHKEIKPFIKDIDNTRWWRIDVNPMTMCSYIIPYLGYINYINYTIYSDVTSLSYKYRHYIFGIKYGCDGKRKYYIYGIPGRRNEQPDEGETGFCNFIPCDDKNKTYGYWICCIDCKSRLIAVADK